MAGIMSNNSPNDKSVEFLCTTGIGRFFLKVILFIRIPKLLGFFLRSPLSHFLISGFIKKNEIDMTDFKDQKYISFNDFFTRKKEITFDAESSHLISPCDSFLSVYSISPDSKFHIKGFDYSVYDFFGLEEGENSQLVESFNNGKCLVFRLCATDYHRYSYIDNGFQTENNYIEGSLYSVQPAACENFRVYTKNRRSWTLLKTENFGTVAQIEVGAFSVGGIVNLHADYEFKKGEEKGYFDLHGSTIVLLFQPETITLLPEVLSAEKENREYKVKAGQHIGTKIEIYSK